MSYKGLGIATKTFMKLSIIGKTNNPWILEVLKNIPTEVEKRTIILIGPIPQIFLSPILRIFLYKVIWLIFSTP